MKYTGSNPASRFGEAYPVGNGQMGAVVYGSFPVERMDLTENTFFSGSPRREEEGSSHREAFYKMRDLLQNGDYEGAHRTAQKFWAKRENYGTALPAGSLFITFCEKSTEGDGEEETGLRKILPPKGWEKSYERRLDIEKGLVEITADLGNNRIRTCSFASHPDKMVVWHISCERPVCLQVEFLPYHGNGYMTPTADGFLFGAKALEEIHCQEPCGVTLSGKGKIETDKGLRISGNRVLVDVEHEASVCLICGTDYAYQMGISDDKLPELTFKDTDYEKIKKRHVEEISAIMSRVKLELEGEGPVREAAKLFQYGRYLLLSSSREDSVLPAHLQGIWNDDVACQIGWSCDMHLDINTQMNYWPADLTGLPETIPPLLSWVKNLAKKGARTAQEFYGLHGWAAELVSNAWCYTAPYWSETLSPYPTGGVWILMNLWEHFLYTQDRSFLEELFPLLEGAVEFFADYVFTDESTGGLCCGPSISAENSFLVQGKSYQISNNCTGEWMVIRELFQAYLKACEMRDITERGRFFETVRELLSKIPEIPVDSRGLLKEWDHDYPPADSQHRHTSHLIGLFPFGQISPEETPLLAEAAEKVIQEKLTPYENWEDTGWARSLLLLYEARLQNGEKAWFHAGSMMECLLEPNGMIYHPATRGTVFDDDFSRVYELDGNTGFTTGIAQMLLQSRGDRIHLLPAIPRSWEKGLVTGLGACGGIQVDIAWEKGRVTAFKLVSSRDGSVTVRCNEMIREVNLKKNQEYCWHL